MSGKYEPQIMKKAYIMYIYETLRKYTDEYHPLTQAELAERIESDYEITIERKSIKANLEALCDMGMPIGFVEGPERGGKRLWSGVYYDSSIDSISDSVLKILIDSVLCASYLNANQVSQIVEWLKQQGSISFRNSVSRTVFKSSAYGRHVHEGEVSVNVEVCHEAIDRKRKIIFNYNDFNESGRLAVKTKGIKASPYYTVVSSGRYYLICNVDGTDDLKHYRMDKITGIDVLEKEPRREMREIDPTFDINNYLQTQTYMFAGKDSRVVLRIKKSCFSDLFDFFGDFKVDNNMSDEEYAVVTLRANLEGMYYWALQYGNNVEVVEPQVLRDRIRETVTSMANKYSITDDDKYSMAIKEAQEENHFKHLLPVRELELAGINLQKKREHLKLKDLHSLSVGNNGISDYSFINSYENLRHLRITEPSIAENTQFNLPELRSVTIGNFDIWDREEVNLKDLSAFSNCKSLRQIRLRNISVDDYSAILDLPKLRYVFDADTEAVEKLNLSDGVSIERGRNDKKCTIVFSERIDRERAEIKAAREERKAAAQEALAKARKKKNPEG